MARRFIDISVPLRADIRSDPPHMLPKIEYSDHRKTAPAIADFFGVAVGDLPEGEYAAVERCEISTHNGTHLDAPYHFFSRMNERLTPGGQASWRIDEVPLEWCFNPAVKLDFRKMPDGYVVTPADIERELDRIEHKLSSLEIVVVNTRAGERYGEDDYVDAGCGVGKAATLWMLEQGVRLVGTDAWSWDAPFLHTKKRIEAGGSPGLIWEGHRAGREIGYSHLEKLSNLEALPSKGFQIVCFPVKVHRGSAGWTRAVAIIDDVA